ncbi:MAG: hypothetical protein EA426_08670 [Spirochaetaceae bacterium]|nr:MAG: hypothetical protein EA426_08670 [Spirochaetaceae bacterium]
MSSNLHQLAASLTEEERRVLRQRIKRALSVESPTEVRIYPAQMREEEKQRLIATEIARLTLRERIGFAMRRLMSSRPVSEVFAEYKLEMMRESIREKTGGSVDPDGGILTAEAVQQVWEVYRLAYPLISFFQDLWADSRVLAASILHVMATKIPNAKHELEQFMSAAQLQDAFVTTENKKAVSAELGKRMAEYFSGIPESVFDEIQNGVQPLYDLKNVCLFPFERFFAHFGWDSKGMEPDENPTFRPAAARDVIEYLDRLYYAAYSASRVKSSVVIHPEILEFYYADKTGVAFGRLSADARTVIEEKAKRLGRHVTKLTVGVRSFFRSFPIGDIIRVESGDPYYRFQVYVPRIRLKEFYVSALQEKVATELDKRFPELRMGIVDRMKKDVFGSEVLPDFEFYRSSAQSTILSLGLPTFRYVKSLNVLYAFLLQHYRGTVHDLVRILQRNMPFRRREVGNDLVLHAAGLEDVLDTIREFDYSFSPESEEGKAFFRVRYSVEKDISQQRSYRNIVAQKDREAKALVEKGLEHLNGVESIFRDAIKRHERANRDTLASAQMHGRETTGNLFNESLKEQIGLIETVKKLIVQLVSIEEGH